MVYTVRKRSKKAGLPPGSMVYIGNKPVKEATISSVIFSKSGITHDLLSLDSFSRPKVWDSFVWIRISGVSDIKAVEKIGSEFKIHPLILEDIVNTSQRPKIETGDDYIFCVARTPKIDAEKIIYDTEQVSFILGKGYLISFDEGGEDLFQKIEQRIPSMSHNPATRTPDYLLYMFLDLIVDNFFGHLEKFGEYIDRLEENVMTSQSINILKTIYKTKRQLLILRRLAWPLRELVLGIERADSSIVSNNVKFYFRDVYDHIIEIIDIIETMRDISSGLLDVYLSSTNNRLNEVMKVLTVITTCFMPLTLITGIYGMNFQHMPELGWKYGYPMAILSMLLISGVMLLFFRRKRWI